MSRTYEIALLAAPAGKQATEHDPASGPMPTPAARIADRFLEDPSVRRVSYFATEGMQVPDYAAGDDRLMIVTAADEAGIRTALDWSLEDGTVDAVIAFAGSRLDEIKKLSPDTMLIVHASVGAVSEISAYETAKAVRESAHADLAVAERTIGSRPEDKPRIIVGPDPDEPEKIVIVADCRTTDGLAEGLMGLILSDWEGFPS